MIVANYRTGSSALASSIGRNLNIAKGTGDISISEHLKAPVFTEPHYRPNDMIIFKDYLANNNNLFVLKVIVDQLDTVEEYKSVLNRDCFKIKLYRENKIDQIVSYYIATITKTWSHKINTPQQQYFVTLDEHVAKYAVDQILFNDRLLDQLPTKFDITTTYEQLGIIENTELVKTMQPTNIQRITKMIEKVYHESR